MPPSHAGIVPAALPAFSAPTGVSVVPSLATSADDSSAGAGAANAAPTARTAHDFFEMNNMNFLLVVGPSPNPLPRERERTWETVSRLVSERVADGYGIEIAIFKGIGA